jgi:serine phosphatase RsbU (regulator of sigma subunit)
MDPDSTETLEYDDVPLVTPQTSWDEISGDPNVDMDPVIWARFVAFLDAVSVTRHRPLNEVLESIVAHCLKIFRQSDRGCLMLIEKGKLTPKVAHHRNTGAGPVRVSDTVVQRVLETRQSLLSYNAQVEFISKSILEEGVFSVMCVPIVAENKILGVLYLDTASPGKLFRQSDLELLTVFANASAAYIEHHLLLEDAIQRRILEEEMRKAAEIQQRLLALQAPDVPGYGVHLGNLPCFAAGGDYVDSMWCGEKLFLALGDVSGKGIPAAMLTSTLQAAVHAQAMTATDLSEIAGRVNSFLHQRTSSEKFATLFLGCLDANSGLLHYVNAGHCPPVLFRKDREEPERLKSTGLIIGAFSTASYEVEEALLGPGDLMVIYSDGFFEQRSDSGEEYGEDRLIRFLSEHRQLDLDQLANRLEEEVIQFAASADRQDDMTQLLIRRSVSSG